MSPGKLHKPLDKKLHKLFIENYQMWHIIQMMWDRPSQINSQLGNRSGRKEKIPIYCRMNSRSKADGNLWRSAMHYENHNFPLGL